MLGTMLLLVAAGAAAPPPQLPLAGTNRTETHAEFDEGLSLVAGLSALAEGEAWRVDEWQLAWLGIG